MKHADADWHDTLERAEELSDTHSETLGAAALDLWHVAAAITLRADCFWTFDAEQRRLAKACHAFRRVAGAGH